MSADGDIVRDLANVPADHHDRCNSRDGRECDCYMTYWEPFLAALARLEAAEAQRDALAEALRLASSWISKQPDGRSRDEATCAYAPPDVYDAINSALERGESDPDYSRAYQDEYQRLWHEAAASRDALAKALREFADGSRTDAAGCVFARAALAEAGLE